jgi:hypothetical protein
MKYINNARRNTVKHNGNAVFTNFFASLTGAGGCVAASVTSTKYFSKHTIRNIVENELIAISAIATSGAPSTKKQTAEIVENIAR